MNQIDRSFSELVIRENIASRGQVEECAKLVQKAAGLGAMSNLPDTMVAKGYVSRRQADALLTKMRAAQAKVTSIGGYELIEKLGQGAIGVVYKARQSSMNRLVAIKVLRPALSRDKAFLERLLREARAAAKLDHHNIVRAIDAGHEQGYQYFVMEFIDGSTLAQRLKQGPLDEVETLRIAHQMAQALVRTQRHGVVHRNIKPGNIMLTSDGAAKLADLGLAKNFETDTSAAAPGKPPGTPYYMSPEQARGETELDTRSDIYSLGATLFHMVTGSPPFDGGTPAMIISKRVTGPIPVARSFRPELSVTTNRLIYRMMAKAPAQRYQTASELLSAIEKAMGEAPQSEGHAAEDAHDGIAAESKPEGRSGKIGLLAGCGVAVLALAVGIWLANRGPAPDPPAPPPTETAPSVAATTPPVVATTGHGEQDPDNTGGGAEPTKIDPVDPVGPSEEQLADLRRREEEQVLANEIVRLQASCRKLIEAGKYGEAVGQADAFEKQNAAELALRVAADLRSKIMAEATERYIDLTLQADAAMGKGDYAAARAVLEPMASFGLPEFAEKMKEKLGQIDSREKNAEQWAKWERIKADVIALNEAGRAQMAVALLETAKNLRVPNIAELIAQQAKALQKTQGAAAEALYVVVFEEHIEPLLAARDYARAKETLEKLSRNDDLTTVAEYFERGRTDIARLASFWESVEARAAALEPGQRIQVGRKQARFVSYKNGMISYRAGSAEAGMRLSKMKSKDVLALLNPARLTEDESRIRTALFLLHDKDPDPLRSFDLMVEVGPGPDIDRYKRKIARAAGRHYFPDDEKVAEQAFVELTMKAARAPDLLDVLLNEFRAEFRHTRCFNERLADMAAFRAAVPALMNLKVWGGHCYLFVKRTVSWHDAKSRCEKLGGHLVTITSAEEQAFIAEKVTTIGWLGATDEKTEGNWEWVTGEKWAYSAWAPGQPDGGWDDEHWPELVGWGNRPGWNDLTAAGPRPFVCEWDVEFLRLTPDMLGELRVAAGAKLPQDIAAEHKKRLAKAVFYRADALPLQYVVVLILNQVEVPYQWDKSAELIGYAAAAGPVTTGVQKMPAGAALKRILKPLGLGYEIDHAGLLLKSTTARPAQGDGKEHTGGQAPAVPRSLEGKVHGKVVRWDPATLRITLEYDFSSREQLADWEGGKIGDDERLRAWGSVVPFVPQFLSIDSIDYDGYFISGGGRVTVRLRDCFEAELGSQNKMHLLYQTDWTNPLISAPAEGFGRNVKLTASIELKGGQVKWTVNNKVLGSAKLQKRPVPPMRVGLGHVLSDTKYDNIRITGIIDGKWLGSVGPK